MGSKTRVTAVFAIVALFLIPSAVSESPFTRSRTSEDCWAGVFPWVRSPIPCSVALDVALTGQGCEDDWCTYTLNMTGTGRSDLPGWLEVYTLYLPGDGAYVLACPPYAVRTVTDGFDLFSCDNVGCQHGALGTEVACSVSLSITQYAPVGKCGFLILEANAGRPFQWAQTSLYVGVCHMPDGSVDFRQWDSG